VDGFSTPEKRSDRVVLEANTDYWDQNRFPQLHRIIFDNTLAQKDAVELVKSTEGRADLVSELSPLETLRVAQSPFAKVVKNRGALMTIFGQFNMRKEGSPWADVRLRQAINYAINREDLIQYAAKGNGMIIPALVPARAFGYDPTLAPYAFDPARARQLLHEAAYPEGLVVRLIASEDLVIQATVIGKMLEQVGLQVDLQILDPTTFNRKTFLPRLDAPAKQQPWDIALRSWYDFANFPVYTIYHYFVLDGPFNWIREQPTLQHLYDQILSTVEQEKQQELIRQMEQHTSAQAYFLFLYNPIQLFAVNKAVEFVPYVTTEVGFAETAVTEQHWSVRKQGAAVQE
jgi:peptide/nickel transport system substrate-binding protein